MRENRPVIALDFPTFEDVKAFLAKFPADEKLYVKIGMELYYAAGPEIVRYVKDLGHSVFLDLKLHDIPNTVKSAMRVLSNLGVDMTNVHAAGGVEMMKAAREGLGDGPILIAVTQLTSPLKSRCMISKISKPHFKNQWFIMLKRLLKQVLMVLFAQHTKSQKSKTQQMKTSFV